MNQTRATSGSSVTALVLWASALVLGGLIVVELGRIGRQASAPDAAIGSPALSLAMAGMSADVVAQVGEYSMLAFSAGSEDVLVVLDGRNEQYFAYRIRNQREVELLERQSLASVFGTAKAIGPGRK